MRNVTKRTHKEQLPAYLGDLHAILERHGVTIATTVEREQAHIRWAGDESALRASGVVVPSYRLPLIRGRFHLRCGTTFGVDFEGAVTRTGTAFTLEAQTQFPHEIRREKGIEVCEFSDRTLYYGSADALVASGFCPLEQLPSKRGKSSSYRQEDQAPRWGSHRHWSGNVVYFRETDEHLAKRLREDSAAGRETSCSVQRAPMRSIVLAPPVENGSITEAERHHIRLLRTIDEGPRDFLLSMAIGMVQGGAERGEIPVRKSHLRLVVDNQESQS